MATVAKAAAALFIGAKVVATLNERHGTVMGLPVELTVVKSDPNNFREQGKTIFVTHTGQRLGVNDISTILPPTYKGPIDRTPQMYGGRRTRRNRQRRSRKSRRNQKYIL